MGHPLGQLGGVAPAALPNLYSTHHVEACYVDGPPSPMLNSEITRLKNLIMIIIISMNKSQELTVFHGRQKLTSAKN